MMDGRSHPECAIEVLPYLTADSRVVIHDFFTTKYDRIEYQALLDRHYEVVARIEEGQSLVVLRPTAETARQRSAT